MTKFQPIPFPLFVVSYAFSYHLTPLWKDRRQYALIIIISCPWCSQVTLLFFDDCCVWFPLQGLWQTYLLNRDFLKLETFCSHPFQFLQFPWMQVVFLPVTMTEQKSSDVEHLGNNKIKKNQKKISCNCFKFSKLSLYEKGWHTLITVEFFFLMGIN